MRKTSEWKIQVFWWISGIFGTGSFWYFMSIHKPLWAFISGIIASFFAVLAVALLRRKENLDQLSDDIVLEDNPAEDFARRYTDQPSHVRFIKALPKLKNLVFEVSKEGWDTGITSEMRQASYDFIDFLEFAWLHLSAFYSEKHFANTNANSFIQEYIRERFKEL